MNDASPLEAERQPAAERVVAIVTSFRPGPSLVEHCALLAEQVHRIVVVDDGSGAPADGVLTELAAAGVQVERQTENAGIANAINRGYAAMQAYDPELVVTFDQDSKVTPGFVEALVEQYDRSIAAGIRVGMVAPEYFAGFKQTHMPQRNGYLEAYQPIQSGLLMPFDVIRALGPQRGDFFIDSVDTEYYLRAMRAGYASVCAPKLDMPHSLGHALHVRVFGRTLMNKRGNPRSISVSSPFRYYYRIRNRMVLNREYLSLESHRALMLRDTFREYLHYCFALYCCRGKAALVSVLWAGWRAGKKRRMGKIPDAVAARSRTITWRNPA